ncbi:hypothetical protein [uncultured Sphingomonas sp.]
MGYYRRRASQELVAARHAVTVEARDRRLALAAQFQARLTRLNG